MAGQVLFTRQAQKGARKAAAAEMRKRVESLLVVLVKSPCTSPPPYERLVGDLEGAYSRRLSIQHRLVYQVLKEEKIVKIIRMCTHYGD